MTKNEELEIKKKAELEMLKLSLQAINKDKRKSIIEESFSLINQDKLNDWFSFVSNEIVPTNALKAAVSIMKEIDKGIPFKEAEINVFKSGDIDPRLYTVTVVAVTNFSKQGEEYRQNWIKER